MSLSVWIGDRRTAQDTDVEEEPRGDSKLTLLTKSSTIDTNEQFNVLKDRN
jgi:hypothetical protein